MNIEVIKDKNKSRKETYRMSTNQKMKNEPNLRPTGDLRIGQSKQSEDPGKAGNKSNLNHRHTQYDIRNTRLFMQNEPNLKTYMPQGIENGVVFYYHFLQISTRLRRILLKKIKNNQKKRAFCNLWTLTHLTPCTAKTYKTISPQITFTLHEIRETKKCKTNPI